MNPEVLLDVMYEDLVEILIDKGWNAKLENANLSYANLTGVDLNNANLDGANLTGADLNNAILNCINHEICN